MCIRALLPESCILGRRLVVHHTATSTNDLAMALDVEEGVAVFAERQTAGRGSRGRAWNSPEGLGLWFSVLLEPQPAANLAEQLTRTTAAAVALAVREQTNLNARIKPPNDIYVDGKKVAGILVEARWGTSVRAVAGIGVNVLQSADDFPPDLRAPAASLAMLATTPPCRMRLAASILRLLDELYRGQPEQTSLLYSRLTIPDRHI